MNTTPSMRVNSSITAPEVMLVTETGPKGVVSIEEAREYADNLGLDLVEVNPEGSPPVVKVMDWNKHLYVVSVKKRQAKRNQTKVVTKEVMFRPATQKHDYETKLRQIRKFLAKSYKVRAVVIMHGREASHPELGAQMIHRVVQDLATDAVLESPVSHEGSRFVAQLVPNVAQ